MDPVTTALTAAWLDAFRRVQSPGIEPQSRHSTVSLTDAIERALRAGGADAAQREAAAPGGGHVDRRA